jgi:hypothetical protein
MVRIVLGGEWRGSEEAHQSLKAFKEYHNAEVYVSSHEEWNLPFPFHFHKGERFLTDTIFNQTNNAHKERYIYQWSGLYSCWNAFNRDWENDDIVVRLRNDLVFPIFQLNPHPNTFHTPAKEWHAPIPFPSHLICNDQLSYGYKDTMDKYFQLPYTFNWDYPRQLEVINRYGPVYGIEEMNRNHLYNNNIELKTFDLIYDKAN